MTILKVKNETLSNYNTRYWKLYNKIEEFLEEFVVVNYKFRLTIGDKLWNDLTFNPSSNL